jgi:outer membrane receptor protein involved in Fe transport
LLNGHRLAPGAFDGSLVDISQIPLSAVDHIEVLDDGTSAIYGSDAVAGVVNIITRKDFDGAETSFRYGGSTEGGAVEYTASQLLGHFWDSGDFVLNYEYDDQGGLDASQRNWIGAQGGLYSLIPVNRRNSVLATGSQNIGSETTLSADVLYSDRNFESDGILNVSSEMASQSSAGHATESAATLGLDRHLFGDWHANITGNYSNTRQLVNTGTFALPAYRLNRPMDEQLANSDIEGIDVLGSGSLVSVYGGAVKASLGGSFRRERFKSYEFTGSPATPISLQRQVASAYGEVLVPYVGEANAQPWARRLEVSAAYRYDHYSSFGSTSNPKVGVLWEPATGLRLRGTFGTSFQAPFLSQLGSPITSNTALIPDNRSPSGQADILEISGGNPALLPETSKSITAGFDYKPVSVSGLAVSMTYFYVLFKNRIQAQHIASQSLLSQPLLRPFIVLNPSLADTQSYFNSPGFQGDIAGLGPAGVVAIVDNQLANIASTVESGLNFSARYSLPTAYGKFNFWVSGTHLLGDRVQTEVYGPRFDIDNTIGEPTSWKARGGLDWARDGFTSSITINHVNAYQNTLFTPSQTIGSWTTTNFYLSYDTGSAASYPARNLRISLSVQNLTDRRPPYLRIPAADLAPGQNAIPFDGANASPVGRFLSLQITKGW